MYILLQNELSTKNKNEEFRRLVNLLKEPLPKERKIVLAGEGIPRFVDCLDEFGKFSEKKFDKIASKLK